MGPKSEYHTRRLRKPGRDLMPTKDGCSLGQTLANLDKVLNRLAPVDGYPFKLSATVSATSFERINDYRIPSDTLVTCSITNMSSSITVVLGFAKYDGITPEITFSLAPGACLSIAGEPSNVYRLLLAYVASSSANLEIAGWYC